MTEHDTDTGRPEHIRCGLPGSTQPMHGTGDLALCLGGSATSFIGRLLLLVAKADPGDRERLRDGFPRLVRAFELWMSTRPTPTCDELRSLLDADPYLTVAAEDRLGGTWADRELYALRGRLAEALRVTAGDVPSLASRIQAVIEGSSGPDRTMPAAALAEAIAVALGGDMTGWQRGYAACAARVSELAAADPDGLDGEW